VGYPLNKSWRTIFEVVDSLALIKSEDHLRDPL